MGDIRVNVGKTIVEAQPRFFEDFFGLFIKRIAIRWGQWGERPAVLQTKGRYIVM